MGDAAADHQIPFMASTLSHNAGVISLIDTKAGLIMGSVAVLLPLLAFLDIGQMGPHAKVTLICALGLFCLSAVFSFLTILPRITSRPAGETCIFYTSVVGLDKKAYQRRVKTITPEQIIDDYADNIHALATIQEKKVKMLAGALWAMMTSIAMVAATISIHAYAGHAGGSW